MAKVRVFWLKEKRGWEVRSMSGQVAGVMATLVLKDAVFHANAGYVEGEFCHQGIKGENLAGCRRVVYDRTQDSEFFDAVNGHMVAGAPGVWFTPLGNIFALLHPVKIQQREVV